MPAQPAGSAPAEGRGRPVLQRGHVPVAIQVDLPPGPELILHVLDPAPLVDRSRPLRLPPHAAAADAGPARLCRSGEMLDRHGAVSLRGGEAARRTSDPAAADGSRSQASHTAHRHPATARAARARSREDAPPAAARAPERARGSRAPRRRVRTRDDADRRRAPRAAGSPRPPRQAARRRSSVTSGRARKRSGTNVVPIPERCADRAVAGLHRGHGSRGGMCQPDAASGPRQADLATVEVSREHELHAPRTQAGQRIREVAEEDARSASGSTWAEGS